mmetsp:Transcript_6507/g.16783  ORF Transcript_6507/g.16783 Transcript_6507/m.16783 type:complete len:918 (-) Transcript_6507:233-2986(-)
MSAAGTSKVGRAFQVQAAAPSAATGSPGHLRAKKRRAVDRAVARPRGGAPIVRGEPAQAPGGCCESLASLAARRRRSVRRGEALEPLDLVACRASLWPPSGAGASGPSSSLSSPKGGSFGQSGSSGGEALHGHGKASGGDLSARAEAEPGSPRQGASLSPESPARSPRRVRGGRKDAAPLAAGPAMPQQQRRGKGTRTGRTVATAVAGAVAAATETALSATGGLLSRAKKAAAQRASSTISSATALLARQVERTLVERQLNHMDAPAALDEGSDTFAPAVNQADFYPFVSIDDDEGQQQQQQRRREEGEGEGDAAASGDGGANRGAKASSSSATKAKPPTVSVKNFLKDVSQDATLLRNFRKMSSMSEQAYYTEQLTDEDVARRYGLVMRSSSKEYLKQIAKPKFDEMDMFESGDGMTVPFTTGEAILKELEEELNEQLDLEEVLGAVAHANAHANAKGLAPVAELGEEEAEAKAEAEECENTTTEEGQREDEDEGENENEEDGGKEKKKGAVQMALETAKGLTALVGGYTKSLNLPVDLVMSAGAAVAGLEAEEKKEPKFQANVFGGSSKVPDNDPCEWLVMDDPAQPVRYFALQGSDSVDHWITNLSFEPVDFEGGALNVKIHAGIYKAAEKLLAQLLPMVEEHMARHGAAARLVFTGHSLGGAIASALVMILVHREYVPREAVDKVYTYGCPAFICESCGCDCKTGECACAGGNAKLLERLDLAPSVFNHLCMHRDIVPRAFACDYTLIQSILCKSDVYREHGCLKGNKEKRYTPSLYRHVGDVYFIQPDTSFLQFARPEGDSPMLPSGHGIWKMVEPPSTLKLAMNTMNSISSTLQNEWAFGDNLTLYNYANDVDHAIGEIMNNPHPLDILKDANAYGHEGGVSRFHKPKNYTRALGVLLKDTNTTHSDAKRN